MHKHDRNVRMADEMKRIEEEADLKKLERRMANKNLADIEEREDALRKRLEELSKSDHDVPSNWQTTQQKLAVLLQEKKKRDNDEKKFDEYVWKLEKEKELEKLVRRKLELEKIQNQTQLLDHMISQKQTELSGIKEENQKRDINNADLLKKALKKGDVLQRKIEAGAIPKRQQALLAESYLVQDEIEGRKIRESILEDLKGKMVRDRRELSYKTTALIKELNNQRSELIRKEEDIFVKRATIERLEERGYDFLAEIELGNAPPMELIVKNIGLDPERAIEKGYDKSNFDINAVIEQSKVVVEEGEQRLMIIRSMIENEQNSFLVDKPYVPPNEKLNERSKTIAEGILNYILGLVYEKTARYERWLDDLRRKSKYLTQKVGKQNKRLSEMYKKRALYESSEKVINQGMTLAIRGLVTEVLNINKMAEDMAAQILCKALIETRPVKMSQPQMESALQELQLARTKLKGEYRARAHHSLIPTSEYLALKASGKTREALLKSMIEDNKEIFDAEAIKIDPKHECVAKIESKLLADLEGEFWNSFELRFLGAWLGGGSTSYGITAFNLSSNGRFAAMSTTRKNYILIYDLSHPVPRVIRVAKEDYTEPLSLTFSYDNWSQLLAVFANGTSKLYSMKGKSRELASYCPYVGKQADEVSALDLSEILTLSCEHIATDQDRFVRDLKTELGIVSGTFHPAFDLFGLQKSIVVASNNGTILKWNTNASFEAKDAVSSKYRYVYCPIVSSKELPFPQGSRVAGQFIPKQPSGGVIDRYAKPHVLREFHYEHKTKILLLQYIGNGSRLVSVDTAGHIFVWDYSSALLKPSLSFKPHYKARLLLDTPQYVPQGDYMPKFPPQPAGNKNPIQLNPNKLSREDRLAVEEYMQNLALDSIVNDCIAVDKTKDGSILYVVPPRVLPNYGETGVFNEYVLYQDSILLKHVQRNYKTEKLNAQIIGAKLSKSRNYIVMQLLLPYAIPKPNLGYIEFVVFRLRELRVNRVKTRIEVVTGANYPFEVTEDIGPWYVPFVCLQLNDIFTLYSLMTGQRVMAVSLKNNIMSTIRTMIPIDGIHCWQDKVIFWSKRYDSVMRYEWVPNISQEMANRILEQSEAYANSWNA